MEKQDSNDERKILAAAAALPPEDRAAFLDAACGSDKEMRARVEGWLIKLEAGDFMAALTEVVPPNGEQSGERIGNYKLLEKIGEGGFGVVWVADQERPVRRRVALKIIKLGMDTKEVIARFGQERQALAMMDHPHIAKVLDAGSTEWGRPYFVMELVRGIKITDYCDQANLPTADRLALFIQVCQAVQHAHQKGIIHRDLKPSNILVTLHDGVPVPKVIDFGVAKATQQQPLSDLTIYTQFEQMIGTPLYMSPEQAEMSGLDIDTRSDIYSLGVLLYELLTGRTPFDPVELMRKGYDEIRRAIREQEAQAPSMFLQTMADETRSTVAQHRQSDPAKLMKLVRGDLDWIVMKSLEKDRTRRYETANGLAMDIQRHLANEPVLARPPTALYRFRRMVRRNRGIFAAAGAVTAALVIGLGMATYSFFNERRALAGETKQRQISEERSRQAQASELKARQFLYTADINLVQEALRTNNVGRARKLLDRHRPLSGEPDLRGWEWRYLWQQCRSGAQARLTKREGESVISVSFSPDGAWLAAGYMDGKVELWNVAKRQLAKVIKEYSSGLASVASSPRGNGRPARATYLQKQAYVAFSPRGDVLATSVDLDEVIAYHLGTGAIVPLCTTTGWVSDLSYSRDGELLAVLTCDPSRVLVLRSADGESVMSYPLPNGGGTPFNNARFSPDKQWLYVSCGGHEAPPKLRCISVPDARLRWEIPIGLTEGSESDSATDIAFSAMDLSPDGRLLAVATGFTDPRIRVLDTATGGVVKSLEGHTGWVCDVTFSKDGKELASASSDQTIRRWATATWSKLMNPLRGHSDGVHALAITEDGRTLASGSGDGEVLLWDATAPRPHQGRRELPPDFEAAIALPGGRSVLGGTKTNWSIVDLLTLDMEPLPVSDAPPGKPVVGQRGAIKISVLSPDGKLRAIHNNDRTVDLFSEASGSKIAPIPGTKGTATGVIFSPDSRRLVLINGGDHGIELWDVATRQELLKLTARGVYLYEVGFTDDGNTLLVETVFWRAPSWVEIEDAERAGGRWPQTEAFPPPPPAPTFADKKNLLEKAYRKRLAEARAHWPEASMFREKRLLALADLLQQQGRFADAEPLFRELLENRRARSSGNNSQVVVAVSLLTHVLISLTETERAAGALAKMADHAREVDSLISEQFKLLAENRRQITSWDEGPVREALASFTHLLVSRAETERLTGNLAKMADYQKQADALIPDLFALLEKMSARSSQGTDRQGVKLAALQAWYGRDAEHVVTCRRLMQLAEEMPDQAHLAERVVKSWCLRPSSDPAMLSRVVSLARHAVDLAADDRERARYQLALGIAEYRAGNDEAAEHALIRAGEIAALPGQHARNGRQFIQCPTRLFRSMILFRQDKEADARKLLIEAESQMKPLPADDRLVFVSSVSQDDIFVWLAYKEARAMLWPKK
ncbi:MAG: serine/threonine-protein kinase [Verrucomicrobiota bacterium]